MTNTDLDYLENHYDELAEMGATVADAAEAIFRACGVEGDFCIQGCTVFGSTNRLLWSALGGFRPEPSYCTERFLTAFAALDLRSLQLA